MTTFAALGDSITLGVGDPVRRTGSWAWRGWAALLAEGTREPSLHILASNGAQFADAQRDRIAQGRERCHAGTSTGLAVSRTAS